jgi:sphingomyelin phosphodiesterase
LQESEDLNERVWIIGHIAPGDNTCFHDYSNYYYQIVDRYSHVIAAQFFGHTHKYELFIYLFIYLLLLFSLIYMYL